MPAMNPDYFYFSAALLCLWLPATAVAPQGIRTHLRAPARRKRDGLRSLLRSKLNWIDALRAALGTWLLFNQVEFLRAGPGAEELAHVLLGVKFAVLLAGTVVQTLWFADETRVIGPLFYLAGLACVLAGPTAGVPAVVLGVNCALLLRRLRLAFLFVPAALGVCGVLFHAAIPGAFGALLFMLPGFLAFALDQNPAYVRRPRAAPARPRRLLAWPGSGAGLPPHGGEYELPAPAPLAETRAA